MITDFLISFWIVILLFLRLIHQIRRILYIFLFYFWIFAVLDVWWSFWNKGEIWLENIVDRRDAQPPRFAHWPGPWTLARTSSRLTARRTSFQITVTRSISESVLLFLFFCVFAVLVLLHASNSSYLGKAPLDKISCKCKHWTLRSRPKGSEGACYNWLMVGENVDSW